EAVAHYLAARQVPLVVDPVMVASSGARLLREDAVEALVSKLFRLATVVTPNKDEATALVGEGTSEWQAVGLVRLGARSAIVTGSGGADHFFDGETHLDIPVQH